MKISGLFNRALGSFGKMGYALKKSSPEILLIGGGIGVVVGAVMACRATHKGLDDILEEHNEAMEEVRKEEGESRSQKTVAVYAKTSLKIARLYGPSVAVGALSLTGIFASNNILKKRNVALMGACTAIDKAFKTYRGRVVERFGEEVDKQILTNTKEEKIEETYVDENGKEKKRKKTINVADPDAESMYMRYFTRSNPYWENDGTYVEDFLRATMAELNRRLRAKKFLTLNEAYHELGFPETKAGMVVGWRDDPINPVGDGQIIFKIKQVCLPNALGEYEMAYAVDFNVDGNIFERMSDVKGVLA